MILSFLGEALSAASTCRVVERPDASARLVVIAGARRLVADARPDVRAGLITPAAVA